VDYYEELDISQDASAEEIHQAYRLAARLLHPDTQPDPKLKSAAERQMIRLNEVLAVLTDPQKRQEYNDSLCEKFVVHTPSQIPPRGLHLLRHWPWGLACCILLVSGLSYLRSNEASEPSASKSGAIARPSPLLAEPAQTDHTLPPKRDRSKSVKQLPLRLPVRPKTLSRPAYVQSSEEPGQPLAPIKRETGKSDFIPAQPAVTARDVSAPSEPTVEVPATPVLSGHWLYAVNTRDLQTPGVYPPEFIELFLSESNGALSGRYWARYRIPNKAVSPEVQFRIDGTSEGDAAANAATVTWVSDDGAKGKLKMTLRNLNSMEVSWWTSEFGRRTALTSGTALLVRQQTR
jgi:hypothetical protein